MPRRRLDLRNVAIWTVIIVVPWLLVAALVALFTR